MKKPVVLMVPVLALAASAAGLALPGDTKAAAPRPLAAFHQCTACHSTEAGRAGVGPSLAGVFGRKSGQVANYRYSAAMRDHDVVWNEQTLNAFLSNPTGTVPGTKMPLPVRSATQRAAIIEYLKTL